MTTSQTRLTYVVLTLAIIAAGLVCRWPGLGLPWPIAKYGGSILWGAMVYAGLRALVPRAPIMRSVIAACSLAVCVEFLRLYHQPALDAFRVMLAGQLLLGRLFSVWNILAYAVGIGCAALCDLALGRPGDL
jgi:hypothetical protein